MLQITAPRGDTVSASWAIVLICCVTLIISAYCSGANFAYMRMSINDMALIMDNGEEPHKVLLLIGLLRNIMWDIIFMRTLTQTSLLVLIINTQYCCPQSHHAHPHNTISTSVQMRSSYSPPNPSIWRIGYSSTEQNRLHIDDKSERMHAVSVLATSRGSGNCETMRSQP